MGESVTFFVPGHPKPGGSKKAFYIAKLKRAVVTEACKASKDWRAVVALKAAEAMRSRPPFDGPLEVEFTFFFLRPKGHFGTRGLKPGKPLYVAVKPDTTKLVRSTEDALTGIVWSDDSRIVIQRASKVYSDRPGCAVSVTPLS